MKQSLPILWTAGALCGVAALVFVLAQRSADRFTEAAIQRSFERFESDLDLSVPAAEAGPPAGYGVGDIIVNLDATGAIRVNGVSLTRKELDARLRSIFEDFPDQGIVVRGDAKANFQDMVGILDLIKETGGWKVAFATQASD